MELISTYSHNLWAFALFNCGVLVFLAVDLGLFHRESHEVTYKESALWSIIWVALSLSFAGWLYIDQCSDISLLFLTGYAIEKSLSMDNVMVFAIIFSTLKIPLKYQHRILFWGIIGALLMRAIMIGLGYKLIQEFHFIMYIFGGFLILTGAKILILGDKQKDLKDTWMWKVIHKTIPLTETLDDQKFWTTIPGRAGKVGTPLLTALIIIELSDVIFAVDSIPAIFAITKDPFIVYTSNVFAILGLRSLYFMLAGAMRDFHYLKPALAIILIAVGAKMLKVISVTPGQSLALVSMILFLGIGLSLLRPHKGNS